MPPKADDKTTAQVIHADFNGLKTITKVATTVVGGLMLAGVIGIWGIKAEVVEVQTEVANLKGSMTTIQAQWREDFRELRDRLRRVETDKTDR